MPGDREWLLSRNAVRAARRAEARRAAGRLPWGAKSRLRRVAEAPTPAAQVPWRRLRSKTHLHEPQSAPAGVAQERVAPLCRTQSAPAEEAQDTCFAGGDPDDAILWEFIDKDIAMETEGLLDQRERSAAARERILESWESELEERAEQIAARERRLLAEATALRPKPGGRGGAR